MVETDCINLVKYDIVKSKRESNDSWVVMKNDSDKRRVVANQVNTTVNKQRILTYDELEDDYAIDYKYRERDAIIGIDSDGWSVYKLNLREVLSFMGAKEINGVFGFYPDDKILDSYPITYEGGDTEDSVNQKFITEVDITNNTAVSIIVEPKQAGF